MKFLWLTVWLLAFVLITACAPISQPESAPTATPRPPTSTTTPVPPTATPAVINSSPTVATTHASATPRPAATASASPAAADDATPMEPQLIMVHIRARSATEVQALRKMNLDIVRITPVEGVETATSKEEMLNSEFVVEAVVPAGLLTKLRSLGYDITEIPPP